jgi:hypothetical protein
VITQVLVTQNLGHLYPEIEYAFITFLRNAGGKRTLMKHSGVMRNMCNTQHLEQNKQSVLFSFKVCGSVTLFLLFHLIPVKLACTFSLYI